MNQEEILIGKINLNDFSITINEILNLDEVVALNLKSDLGIGKIYVYSNEGNIPHFHINGKGWKSCIKIYEPKYFIHGDYTQTFSSKQRKILNSYLHQRNNTYSGTNWEYISYVWKLRGNPIINIPENPIQPDYTKLS